jgi:hypothetical protein
LDSLENEILILLILDYHYDKKMNNHDIENVTEQQIASTIPANEIKQTTSSSFAATSSKTLAVQPVIDQADITISIGLLLCN